MGPGHFEQCYNTQVAVDEQELIIVGNWVSPSAADSHHLLPTIAEVETNTGSKPKRVLAEKHIVEPVFGWIQWTLGFRRFSLRGLAKVRAEWDLVCSAMNPEAHGKPVGLAVERAGAVAHGVGCAMAVDALGSHPSQGIWGRGVSLAGCAKQPRTRSSLVGTPARASHETIR